MFPVIPASLQWLHSFPSRKESSRCFQFAQVMISWLHYTCYNMVSVSVHSILLFSYSYFSPHPCYFHNKQWSHDMNAHVPNITRERISQNRASPNYTTLYFNILYFYDIGHHKKRRAAKRQMSDWSEGKLMGWQGHGGSNVPAWKPGVLHIKHRNCHDKKIIFHQTPDDATETWDEEYWMHDVWRLWILSISNHV